MSFTNSPRAKNPIRSAPSRNIERKNHYDTIPSRVVLQKVSSEGGSTSPSRATRIRTCSTGVDKPENVRKLSRNESAPARRLDTRDSVQSAAADGERIKDVMFLRKMLAMNKKQEMMLNKRLSRLLEEEEAQNNPEGIGRVRHSVESQQNSLLQIEHEPVKDSPRDTYENNYVPEKNCSYTKLPRTKPVEETPTPAVRPVIDASPEVTPVRKVQYDINGRRIYYFIDIDKKNLDEEIEMRQKVNNEQNTIQPPKPVDSCSKIVKRGSACSKKTFTMKKSLTYINNHGKASKKSVAKSKKKARKDDGDSPNLINSENPLDFELRPRKFGCHGDGGQVQNLVVHCSTVYSNTASATARKNVKVWNYESLPSLKSENSFNKNTPDSSSQRSNEAEGRNSRNRPVSLRNNNIQIKFKNPPSRKDERGSIMETLFLVHSQNLK